MSKVLGLDFESFSATDIGACGSYKYMEDPEFEILLMSYAYDDDEVTVIDLTAGEKVPLTVMFDLTNPAVTKAAWNCAFERNAILTQWGVYCPPEQWEDSMILAGQCGLPMSLAGASEALGLGEDQAKMKEGKALIRYFCQPCKPTKTNGMRTRNLPEHAPEKWETFKKYNGQDVVAERAIRKMLSRWAPTEREHDFWCLDARINERGVRIDRKLAINAVAMDEKYKAELTERAIAITGLENPKSVTQVKNWLADQEGKCFPSLNKKVVAEVVSELQTDEAKEFMSIRTELSKSSTAKYAAMLRSIGRDDHVRGCFQFYGANKTGRFVSRLVQFQNMSKNEMPDLADCRELVRDGHYSAVKALYGGVAQPLSELVRTAIIPEEGHKILVADFSAIEARVIAWLAGEQWRLDVFNNGGDIYCMSASQMFKVPVVKHGENGHLRQKGKVAELACIAEGQPVLTDRGLVPIESVTRDMKVWDGENWVAHEGVVCNGYREVITYDGLTATADHVVWVEGKSRPIPFGDAASCGARLLRTGAGQHPLRMADDHIPGKKIHSWVAPPLCPDALRKLWKGILDKFRELEAREIERLPALLAAEKNTGVAGETLIGSEIPVRKSEQPGVQELRRARDPIRFSECCRRRGIPSGHLWGAGQGHADRPHRHEQELRPGESAVLHTSGKPSEQKNHSPFRVPAGNVAICGDDRAPYAGVRYDPERDNLLRRDSGIREKKELENNRKTVAVYDIRNAGEHHRYTVSGVLVHNCGYGGGVNALKAFGADKMGMTEEEMQETVDLWRESSPKICQLWKTMEKAACRCVLSKAPTKDSLAGIRFDYENGVLWMTLPSGRRLAYWGAQYTESRFHPGRRTLSYMGVDQQTKKWNRIETWGGKLVENLVQATARDCLRESMFALDAEGYDIRAHVHDEVIVTEPIGGRSVEQMAEVMGRAIDWAPGLPLRADGYETPFYMKD